MKYPVELIETSDGTETIIKKFNSSVTKHVLGVSTMLNDNEYKVIDYTKNGVNVMHWSKETRRFI